MNKTKLLLPFELEYYYRNKWHPYGRYTSLKKARQAKSEAIGLDKSNDFYYEYRIIESKVIE